MTTTDTNTVTSCKILPTGKPTLSIGQFLGAIKTNLTRLPALAAAVAPGTRIDPKLREEVMVAVSRLNQCRHCTAIHTAWGNLAGLTDEELANLGDVAPEDFDRPSWLAIQYARCLVVGGDSTELEAELQDHYSTEEVARIRAVAGAINLANRLGNTWDSLEGRLLGKGAEGGSKAVDELAIVGLIAPLGAPFLLVSKALRTLKGEPDLG